MLHTISVVIVVCFILKPTDNGRMLIELFNIIIDIYNKKVIFEVYMILKNFVIKGKISTLLSNIMIVCHNFLLLSFLTI